MEESALRFGFRRATAAWHGSHNSVPSSLRSYSSPFMSVDDVGELPVPPVAYVISHSPFRVGGPAICSGGGGHGLIYSLDG